ncbi:hypothetical protein SLH46_21315 [Draconibacterium sp. IB214405]|uniref:hypothetical protein n=1 Tax=Draconibacterium sp. IB214405 TaxID=3097352 RepID=UPI002A0DBFD1|nr:hypothetical protein [Draconibacterium sp. IB214405]MDX8341753.1 hypothetical protein [Draconibacterium sp. IB214405]
MRPLSKIQYGIDKFISGSSRKQILSWLLIVMTTFLFFWIFSFLVVNNPPNLEKPVDPKVKEVVNVPESQPTHDGINSSMNNRFLGIFSQYIDPGNVHMAADGKKWYAAIIAIVGAILFNGVFISTLTNMIERRIERINEGFVRYKLTNHVVIAGYEDYIIGEIKKKIAEKTKQKIIIQTSNHPDEIKEKINVLLSLKERKEIIYYQCKRDSVEDVLQLYPEKASSIYILGESSDWERDNKSLSSFKLIQNRIITHSNKKKNNKPIPVSLFIENQTFYDVIKDYNIESNSKIEFRLINYYDEWSRRIFADPLSIHPDQKDLFKLSIPAEDFQSNRNKRLELIIVGFNTMGQSIVRNAIRLLHFPNHSTTKITIIDKKADELFEEFSLNYPGFQSLYDFEFDTINNNFLSHQVQTYIQEIYLKYEIQPHFIIALGNTSEAFKAALNLPKIVFKKETPIWIRQEIAEGGELLRRAKIPPKELGLAERSNAYTHFSFFGMLDTELMALRDYQKREKLAQTAHKTYLETGEQMEWLNRNSPAKPSELPYEDLAEMYKWSNRHLADSYILKLKGLGYYLIENENYDNTLYEKVENIEVIHSEAMAQTEHARYVGERVMAGWTLGPREDKYKTHPDILTWEQLGKTNEQVQEYDKELVVNMIKNLKENGFTVLRKKEEK